MAILVEVAMSRQKLRHIEIHVPMLSIQPCFNIFNEPVRPSVFGTRYDANSLMQHCAKSTGYSNGA